MTCPRRGRLRALAWAGALAAAAPACSRDGADPSQRAGAAPLGSEAIQVAVAPAKGLPGPGPAFTTYLEAERQADLVAEAAGEIRELRVREGDRVAAGDTLLLIDDRDARLRVQRDQAEYEWARSQYDRVLALDKEGHVSAQEVDQSRLQVARTEAALGLSRVGLARCTVRAPIAGLVWMVRVEPLHNVTVGQPLLRVTDADRLRASVYLPAELRPAVRIGARVSLEPVRGGPAIPATVSRVDPLTDPASGTFKVVASFRRGRGQPEPGAEVRLVLPRGAGEGACLVPLETIVQTSGDSSWVWRLDAGRVYRSPIVIGPARSDAIEVDAGLAAGTPVVVSSNRPLAEGAVVEVVEGR